jgi:cytochrome c oxidase subunit 2
VVAEFAHLPVPNWSESGRMRSIRSAWIPPRRPLLLLGRPGPSTTQTGDSTIGAAAGGHVPALDGAYTRNFQIVPRDWLSMHIATAPELWFEKPGKSPPAAPPAEERGPIRGAVSAGGLDLQRRFPMRQGRVTTDFVEGAVMRMLVLKRWAALATAAVPGIFMSGVAFAGVGQPSPWQLGFQQPATPVMENIVTFHNYLLWLITAITAFVLVLLVIVFVRFNAKANPTPSRTTHNTLLEVMWTLVPVVILVAIAVPSFKLLFFELTVPPADVTVKATGKQWYWSYSYPDAKFEYDSLMLKDGERKPDQPRLLAVDNALVVPVNKVVRVQVIGSDVIHSFSVPAFGIKIDAVPGRLNETWFKAEREGIYYGQCSELCGRDHAFMPIEVKVVSEKDYAAWLEDAKKKYAADDSRSEPARFAAK